MSVCTKAISGAYDNDKRETLNSLLRVKTPFPKRNSCEEISVKTAECAYFPLKCLEAAGMIACGALLCPMPCTVCKIETEHVGTEVSVKKIYPSCTTPNIPCRYQDKYLTNEGATITEGWSIGCTIGNRPEGDREYINATSSLTGYDCISSGIGKIVNTIVSMVFCPISSCYLICKDN